MQRAKRLLEGLRIHHLGFGFFWTVTFIVLAGFQGAGAIADYWQTYILTEQALMPLAVGALAPCALSAIASCPTGQPRRRASCSAEPRFSTSSHSISAKATA